MKMTRSEKLSSLARLILSNNNNVQLEKYEVKKPDYDYVKRDYEGMRNARFASVRYDKVKGEWMSKTEKKDHARLMFLGDITCFSKQFVEAQIGRGYDFGYEFEIIKNVFAKSDLVAGNLETMIFPEAPYRTEKLVSEQNFHCNAPVEFLDAIRKAGVDVLTNANNHVLDTGAVGIGETIDYIEQFGFIHTGSFKSDKKRYEMINVNGFKLALIAFATEFNNKKENLTAEGAEFLLNEYSEERAKVLIEDARKNGAEIVVTCIHWGTEHKLVQNSQQEEIAKTLAGLGYDCIIGSHPHVLQPYTVLETDGKKVPVFYSLGNFVSHNSAGTKSRSVVACVDLKRENGAIKLECSYIPTFTSAKYSDKRYVVLPISKKSANVTNKKRLKLIADTLGSEIEFTRDVDFDEFVEKKELAGKIAEAAKKLTQTDLKSVKKFPVEYDDGTLRYTVNQKSACCKGVSQDNIGGSFTVPDSVQGFPIKEIREGAFEAEQKINKVNFRRYITVIPKRAFKNCIGLEGVQLGSATREIGDEAFENCVNLSSVVLKEATKKVGKKAFANCINLRSVKIPSYTTEIADNAFECCEQVTFYCAKGSYADKYAAKKEIPVQYMYGPREVQTVAAQPVMGPMNGPEDKHPAPIIAACYYLGKPLPKSAVCGKQPSHYLGTEAFDGTLETIRQLLGDHMPELDDEEFLKSWKIFRNKYKSQAILEFNDTDFTVYFCDWILFGKNRGFSHDNYFDYELYNKESDVRDTFLSEGYRVFVRDVCNKKGYGAVLFDKAKFNKKFAKFVNRDFIDASTCTQQEFEQYVATHDKCFAKPIRGTGGAGARVLDLKSDTPEKMYEICHADGLIVEDVIKQHPTLAEFNESTLNTVRINTLFCKDGKVRVLAACARFGRAGNVVDNFHGGGVCALVDVDTGYLITESLNRAHLRNRVHPDSKKEFIGFQFPEWKKVTAAVCAAARMMPNVRHVGWDVAVTDKGEVEFVEGNSRPNFDVLQSPDQIGRLFKYEEYIRELAEAAGIPYVKKEPLVIDITGMEAEG